MSWWGSGTVSAVERSSSFDTDSLDRDNGGVSLHVDNHSLTLALALDLWNCASLPAPEGDVVKESIFSSLPFGPTAPSHMLLLCPIDI